MGRGPKPKTPAHRMRVIGSHKQKTNHAAPDTTGRPVCPRSLSLAAKKHWKSLVPQLAARGIVGELDVNSIARYCILLARLDECERHIEKEGFITEYPNGQSGKSHYVGIATDTSKLLIQLEKELGLTPYSRKGIVPESEPKTEEPSAKYFG